VCWCALALLLLRRLLLLLLLNHAVMGMLLRGLLLLWLRVQLSPAGERCW
jgi:hypothetical protein